MKEIAIITVNYNKADSMRQLVSSLQESTNQNFTLFVMDNNSSKECQEEVKQMLKDSKLSFHFIPLSANAGWGNALNYGFKAINNCGYQFTLVINNDTKLDKNAINKCLETLQDPKIGIVGFKILNEQGSITSVGGRLDWFTKLTGITRENKPRWKETETVILNDNEYVDDCCWMIKSKIMNKAQYPPYLFLYFEELYIVRETHRMGFKIAYNPKAEVIHS